MLRNATRWIALVSIVAVIVMTVLSYVGKPGIPPVRMPGGDRTDNLVTPELIDSFSQLRQIDANARQHFVVQFDRELTAAEIDNFEAQYSLRLSGPVPEFAYITSISAGEWLRVQNVLEKFPPVATKVFEIRVQDKLAPRIRDPHDPALVLVPPYAMVDPNTAEIFVRFHADVTVTRQREILGLVGATQPDGSPVDLGPSGIWAVALPAANVDILVQDYDEVQFVEPKMPPVELDIDQARLEVGAGNLGYGGAGVLIAQWEQCQVSTMHVDMAGRAEPVEPITIVCRKWQYKDANDSDRYDIGEMLGVDLDEDGVVETTIHDGGLQQAANLAWEDLDLRYDALSGRRYAKQGVDPDKLELGDIGFLINTANSTVSPFNLIEPLDVLDVGNNLYPVESELHPTMVAGIMIGNSESNVVGGEPKYPGLLPAGGVRSYAWRHDTVIDDYSDAMAHGARISSNSFGWQLDYPFSDGVDPYIAMSQTYDELVSGRTVTGSQSGMPRRMLIVASVGNAGHHADFWSTARVVNSTKNVISVGNVSSSRVANPPAGLGYPSLYSSRGPTVVGALAPTLTAPGSQFNCVAEGAGWDCDEPDDDGGITSTKPVDAYYALSGTSFSTPIVSGAAAQLAHHYQDTCNSEPAPQDLRAMLVHSAKDLTYAGNLNDAPSGTEWIGPDYIFGYGMLQADRALDLVRNAVTEDIDEGWVEHRVFVDSVNQLVMNGDELDLRVTLVWDDPPYFTGFPPRAETGTLHNDLDLEVIDPNGRRHLPWVLAGGTNYAGDPASRISRSKFQYVLDEWRDHRNTIEQVVVSDVTADLLNRNWTIRVRGNEIRRGPQTYTLVSEVFKTIPDTPCGDFSNGSTVMVSNPLDLPSTPLYWMLFWVAVIILIWLTVEALAALYETYQNQYPMVMLLLMLLGLLVLLYVVFRLLVMGLAVYLGYLMLLSMAYVLWRAVQSP